MLSVHDTSGNFRDSSRAVLTQQILCLHLRRPPCRFCVMKQIGTQLRQHNWPASTVCSVARFLHPAFREDHFQVSRKGRSIQMLLSADFCPRSGLRLVDGDEQGELG